MELTFLGVGEAFDPHLGNAAYLIQSQTTLLIDCGYAVPYFLFGKFPCDWIDALYITHFHADHVFGIPALFYRWTQEGRQKALTVISQYGSQERLTQLLETAYPGMGQKISFPLIFVETEDYYTLNELSLHFAPTEHSLKNLAIRIDTRGNSIGISGDGDLTPFTQTLFAPCTALIHESFTFNTQVPGHTTAQKVVSFAKGLPLLKQLALTHLQREERINNMHAFLQLKKQASIALTIPAPGDTLKL